MFSSWSKVRPSSVDAEVGMLQEHHYARPPNYFIGLHRSQRGLMTSDLVEGDRKPTNRPPNIAAFGFPRRLALPLPCPQAFEMDLSGRSEE